MNKPVRKFKLNAEIEGDTEQDIINEFKQLILRLLDNKEQNISTVSGGYTSSHIVTMEVNQEMTHDLYVQELEAYVEKMNK